MNTPLQECISRVAQIHQESNILTRIDKLHHEMHTARNDPRSAAYATDQWRLAQSVAAQKFAELNGWTVAKEFSIDALIAGRAHDGAPSIANYAQRRQIVRPLMDHSEYFRIKRTGRGAAPTVAIVAHLYETTPEEIRAILADMELQLEAHFPPNPMASWYVPDGALCVCYTRPSVAVKWLPEQAVSP
jgi:hypothetical protein